MTFKVCSVVTSSFVLSLAELARIPMAPYLPPHASEVSPFAVPLTSASSPVGTFLHGCHLAPSHILTPSPSLLTPPPQHLHVLSLAGTPTLPSTFASASLPFRATFLVRGPKLALTPPSLPAYSPASVAPQKLCSPKLVSFPPNQWDRVRPDQTRPVRPVLTPPSACCSPFSSTGSEGVSPGPSWITLSFYSLPPETLLASVASVTIL